MGGDAAAVQHIEGGGGVVGDIPHHAAPVGDGLAVGQGRGGGQRLAGHPVGGVGDVVEGIAYGAAALAVPQHIAALQPGGGHQGGGAARGAVQLVLLALAGGLVHVLEVDGALSAAAHAVIVVGHHISVRGLRQTAHRAAGGVGADGSGKGDQVHIPAPVGVPGPGEFAGGGVGVVAGEHGASGVGVAVVQGNDLAVLVHQNKLVEGVADVAVGDVHHVVEGIGDGHVALPHRHGQVGLVIEAVAAGVHLVAGADIQVAAVLVAAQAARVKGDGGVGPLQAGGAQPVPVLVILDHPDDLGGTALGGVGLAEDQEIIVGSGVEAAPDGQLRLQGPAGEQSKVPAVVLNDHLAAGVFHPGESAVVFVQVGGHRLAPGGIVLLVDVAALRRCGGCCRDGEQGQQQRPGTDQSSHGLQQLTFHQITSFLIY